MESSIVPRTGIPCFFVPMGAPTSVRGVFLLLVATVRALLLLVRLRPRVTFATGGYVSVPVAVASWLLRVPVVLYLPDIVPGKAVTRLAPIARSIGVSADGALPYLPPSKVTVTGYPVRDVFRETDRATARQRLGVPPQARVLAVFGGSQGSRSINEALAVCLPALTVDTYVLHICGIQRLQEAEAAAATLPADRRERYHLYPYLHDRDMAEVLVGADLVLCRSGASTLGELPAAGVPAVLIPLPAAGVHQGENAAYLADRGAAVVVPEAEVPHRLCSLLQSLLNDDERLASMAHAARLLDRPDAAAALAALIQRGAR